MTSPAPPTSAASWRGYRRGGDGPGSSGSGRSSRPSSSADRPPAVSGRCARAPPRRRSRRATTLRQHRVVSVALVLDVHDEHRPRAEHAVGHRPAGRSPPRRAAELQRSPAPAPRPCAAPSRPSPGATSVERSVPSGPRLAAARSPVSPGPTELEDGLAALRRQALDQALGEHVRRVPEERAPPLPPPATDRHASICSCVRLRPDSYELGDDARP